jgi:aminoglycoside/choline kinase family phosphotransferase
MTNRSHLADVFLAQTEWAHAKRRPLAGDASNRRYERLTDGPKGQTAVLMDAPPEKGEDVRPFVTIARHLAQIGLSAPKILAESAEHGFLLLEDLGDDLFARVIPDHPDLEHTLYATATDALIKLHDAPLPQLAPYDPPLMTDMAALAFSHYQAGVTGAVDIDVMARFSAMFEQILRDTTRGKNVLIQRDYHAENLLWLPARTGFARVGLLDFQDAMAGHPAYDLVSLLQDARRDVPAAIEAAMISRYVSATGMDDHSFRTAYAVLGAQRNLRILGVFARLCVRDGKPHYVDLIPRVWDHVVRDLDHPALAPVADMILTALPAPTLANLQLLKDKCLTHPTQ